MPTVPSHCVHRSASRSPRRPRPSPTTARPSGSSTPAPRTSPASSAAWARHWREGRPVAERNHGVYATHSLRELYDQLMAGRSESVHNQAAALQRLHDTVDHLSSTLARDLQELGQVWRGSSGPEDARRGGLIVSYSRQLATDFRRLPTALTHMAADLHDAQGKAENPAHVEGNSHMIDDAIAGGVAPGPLRVVAGGLWGPPPGGEAKQPAQDRKVALVARLAGDYEMNQATWPQAPLPPDGMPDDRSR